MNNNYLAKPKDVPLRVFVVNLKKNCYFIKDQPVDQKPYHYETKEALFAALAVNHTWPDILFFDHSDSI